MSNKNRPGGTRVFYVMEKRTETLATEKAGIIQNECANYNCTIIEVGLIDRNNARITVEGTPEDLDALFELIKDPEIES